MPGLGKLGTSLILALRSIPSLGGPWLDDFVGRDALFPDHAAKLGERPGFDLTNPLPGETEHLADFFQGMRLVAVEPEPHDQHFLLVGLRSEERRVGKEGRY